MGIASIQSTPMIFNQPFLVFFIFFIIFEVSKQVCIILEIKMNNSNSGIKLQLQIKNQELSKAERDYYEAIRNHDDSFVFSSIVNRINKIKAEITDLNNKLKFQ